MDIASSPWLNPIMRSGFLALCGVLTLATSLPAQQVSAPFIIDHPPGLEAHLHDTVTLTPLVGGSEPLSYQWHKNNLLIPGATTRVLTLPAVTLNDLGLYHVIVTNPYGTAQTLPALVYVTKRPQTITLLPTTTTAVAGSSIVLSATSSANLPVTLSLVSGAASLSGNVLTGSGGNVVVRATQPGDEITAAAEPVDRLYSFVSGSLSPFITSPPLDQTVVVGESATLRAAAIGTPTPGYQWQKDGAAVPGATSTVLTIPVTTLADAGRYTIVVTNVGGVASASATLTVRTPPVITTGPASQSVFAGDRTTLSVTTTGVPTPTLQWRKNGTAISGATNPTLSFASTVAADAARYEVVATNVLGSVTSAPATLTVNLRDFSGTYFGTFNEPVGNFAVHVRPDRTGVFLAHIPSLQTGIVIPDLRIDLTGNFSANTTTIASAVELASAGSQPDIAAAPRPVTLRGSINDASGSISGSAGAVGASFQGMRASRTGSAAAVAGLYRAALIGSAAGRGYVVVGPDAQAFVLSASNNAIDATRGTVDEAGRLVATTATQTSIELTLAEGALNGVMRAPDGATGVIAGVMDGRPSAERLANLSVRTVTSAGASTLITGFVVTGTTSKQVLVRAAGPALGVAPFNIPNVVANPSLQLFRGNASVGQNDNWGTPAGNVAAITAATTRAGAFPFRAGSQDAALLMTLTPGAYSVVVGGGTGTALAEVYEVLQNNEVAGTRRLVNVSARGLVSPAAPFIAGFVITGNGPQRVLIRGIGPRLGTAPFNVAGVLANPRLSVFKGSTVIKSNDDWFRDADATLIREAAARAGAFALGASSLDAAVLLFLEPGAYTAQLNPPANANAANSTGLALIEIYESPLP